MQATDNGTERLQERVREVRSRPAIARAQRFQDVDRVEVNRASMHTVSVSRALNRAARGLAAKLAHQLTHHAAGRHVQPVTSYRPNSRNAVDLREYGAVAQSVRAADS